MAFVLGPVAEARTFILYQSDGTPERDYEMVVRQMRAAEPGDEIVFANGRTVVVRGPVQRRGASLHIDLGDGTILKVPASPGGFAAAARGAIELARGGAPIVRVVEAPLNGEYLIVEKIDVPRAFPDSLRDERRLTLAVFLERERKNDSRLSGKDPKVEALIPLMESTARWATLGGVDLSQVAWDETSGSWKIVDWGDGHREATSILERTPFSLAEMFDGFPDANFDRSVLPTGQTTRRRSTNEDRANYWARPGFLYRVQAAIGRARGPTVLKHAFLAVGGANSMEAAALHSLIADLEASLGEMGSDRLSAAVAAMLDSCTNPEITAVEAVLKAAIARGSKVSFEVARWNSRKLHIDFWNKLDLPPALGNQAGLLEQIRKEVLEPDELPRAEQLWDRLEILRQMNSALRVARDPTSQPGDRARAVDEIRYVESHHTNQRSRFFWGSLGIFSGLGSAVVVTLDLFKNGAVPLWVGGTAQTAAEFVWRVAPTVFAASFAAWYGHHRTAPTAPSPWTIVGSGGGAPLRDFRSEHQIPDWMSVTEWAEAEAGLAPRPTYSSCVARWVRRFFK